MKPASFLLSLLVSAPLLLASTGALAAPGDKAPKKKPKITAKGPKNTGRGTDNTKAAEAKDEAKPEAAPENVGQKVVPETKAANAQAPEVAPVPVAGTAGSAAPAADRPAGRHRDEEIDETGKFAVAPLLGYGSNYFGLAIGARAGYTLPAKVYVGGTLMYHFGSTYGYGGYYGGASISSHALYPAGEVGYDIHVGPVTIRPYAGVGIAFVTASSSYLGNDVSETNSSLLLYPGATAHWNIPRSNFFVGGDTRMLILTRGGDPSFGFYATAGMKF